MFIMQLSKNPVKHIRFVLNVQKILQKSLFTAPFTTSVDVFDVFTSELLHRHWNRTKTRNIGLKDFKHNIRCFADNENNDVSQMSLQKLDETFQELLTKNKDKQIHQMIQDCLYYRKFVSVTTLKKLFRNYSVNGRLDFIIALQEYCVTVDPKIYKRNGDFLHYLAKAQCMKGNSEKGLSILTEAYTKYTSLRSLYRVIFKELIHDSVSNRSEATLVIFKKYVLYFSKQFNDEYPLVCFWHICWSSTWFSDQVLSDELLEASEELQEVIRDKATAFAIYILRDEYNEDAVVRLLQTLLKYSMMVEYVKVLQILFNYKLKNRDTRGCAEILRNCEVLGVSLPSNQQGKYIKMLIDGKSPRSIGPPTFKLKF